jgi:hypothetical protein
VVTPATYEILSGGAAIRCLRCNRVSHNLNDVAQRYCGNCHVFHEFDPAQHVNPGDVITLNSKARAWTRGKIFFVDEVGRFGVKCWTEGHPGQAFYLAPWEQIESITTEARTWSPVQTPKSGVN